MREQALHWLTSGMPPMWAQLLALLAYMKLEWWLPRTDKVRANSSLELIGNVMRAALMERVPLVRRLVGYLASQQKQGEAPSVEEPKP